MDVFIASAPWNVTTDPADPIIATQAQRPPPFPFFRYSTALIGLSAATHQNFPHMGWQLATLAGLIAMLVTSTEQKYTDKGMRNCIIGSAFGAILFTAINLLLLSDAIED